MQIQVFLEDIAYDFLSKRINRYKLLFRFTYLVRPFLVIVLAIKYLAFNTDDWLVYI